MAGHGHPRSDAYLWSDPFDGLRLGASADGSSLSVRLENVGHRAVQVRSHVEVAGGGRQLEWFVLALTGDDRRRHVVRLTDDRDKSQPVTVLLAPGALLDHELDLGPWTSRAGAGALPPGTYTLDVEYDAPRAAETWSGTLVVTGLTITTRNEGPR